MRRSLLNLLPAPIVTGLRQWRDQRRLRAEPLMTPFGFRLLGSAANQSMIDGTFESEEVAQFRALLPGSECFVNVGANIGYYICLARQMGVPSIAFEPLAQNLAFLYANLGANRWTDTEVFPLALADQPGVLELYGGYTGASLVRGWAGMREDLKQCVAVNTLDGVLGDRLRGKRTVLMVDIEGAEYGMLLGAKLFLASTRPLIFIEICSNEHQPGGRKVNPRLLDTFELLWSSGYTVTTADHGRRLIDRAMIQQAQRCEGPGLAGHNFIASA